MKKVRTLTFHRPINKDELRKAHIKIEKAKKQGEKVEIFWEFNKL